MNNHTPPPNHCAIDPDTCITAVAAISSSSWTPGEIITGLGHWLLIFIVTFSS